MKPGGFGMLLAALAARGMGEFSATTHCGGGGGGRADIVAESEVVLVLMIRGDAEERVAWGRRKKWER